MARTVEKTGKTVQEAIAAALAELALTVDDVHVDVLDEGKAGGLFGLLSNKLARVRVSELEDDERVPPPAFVSGAAELGAGESDGPDAFDGGADAGEYGAQPAAGGESGDAGPGIADVGSGPGEGYADGANRLDAVDIGPEVERAIAFLSEVFRGIHVNASMSAEPTEDGFLLDVESDDSGILIGHRGETLDSIQYLVNLYLNKGRGEYLRVTIDVEDYRKKREAGLISLADRMADKVVRLRRNVTLDVMNSYERRIIHSALQNHPKVETYSIGEEPNRKVVVTLKNRGGYSSR
jgi:spoIIIJ-associated protein